MIQIWKRMLAVSALPGKPARSLCVPSENLTFCVCSHIKGVASHKIVSDGQFKHPPPPGTGGEC